MNTRHIVMIGTARDTQGGISSVVHVLSEAGLLRRCGIEYLATHCDGGPRAKSVSMAKGWLRFISLLLRGRVALLHAHTASRASFWRKTLFMVPSLLLKVPVVLHLHGAEFQVFYGQECTPAARRCVRWVFERASRVVVLSASWKDWAEAAFPVARVQVIPNPVVIPARSAIDAPMRQDASVLFLGRLGQRKGVFDLLQAVAALQPRHPGLRLRLGGDGELEAVGQQATALGIGQQIELLGWVRGEAKSRLLEESCVFVLPSYNEGLPMSVLEAMAHGLPVVSTPVGGIPEAVSDGEEGFLVPPGDVAALTDRLARLLEDKPLRTRMGRAARERATAEFGALGCVTRWVTLYRELGVPCDEV